MEQLALRNSESTWAFLRSGVEDRDFGKDQSMGRTYLSAEERDNLVAYLDGELNEPAARELEAMLARNPDARRELEALKRSFEMLDYLPRPDASPQFTSRTLQRLTAPAVAVASSRDDDTPSDERRPAPARWPLWLVGPSWALVFVAALLLGYQTAKATWLPRPIPAPADPDAVLVQELELFENKPLFNYAEDIYFIRALDVSGLFANER